MSKKCLFGGTFDPIHDAHLSMAEAAKAAFGLDEVVFMTAGDPYFKTSEKQITPAAMRLEMTRLAMIGHEGFAASDLEVTRDGHTYTCETLEELKRLEPETEWYFMIGADCVESIGRWYRPDVIFNNAVIIAANRNDQVPEDTLRRTIGRLEADFGARIRVLQWDGIALSSSEVREMVARGCEDIPVPPAVLSYIRRHDLYLDSFDEAQIVDSLRRMIKPSRLEHTMGVADTAQQLASVFGESPARARLAGLLHDCAKSEADALTHGPEGARKAADVFGVRDEGVLEAIRTHTTGKPGMNLLSKILYVADYIEPGRDRAPRLEQIRKEATKDLDLAVCHIAEDTLKYLRRSGTQIDAQTEEVYNYYSKICKGR